MKNSYPIILMPDKVGYVVYVPDFDINTRGNTLTEPTAFSEVKADSAADIVTLVDVDFGEYRRKNDMRAVKKSKAS